MNFIHSFNNKTILIPLLQRDYVQGGREDVISPFIDSLLEKDTDLNYIYGYEEDGCFVPIDGQQRLTTLWLLYLYLYSRKHQMDAFKVRMKFSFREYAEDFCERLYEHLDSLLGDIDEKARLDEAIINQRWFIRSWLSNASVKNMLRTLKIIHRKIKAENLENIWRKLVNSTLPSISFSFLQMDEESGLDDDIYIKMNGRGRKLTAFENLKSYMDEHVSDLCFADKWKSNMDNVWADMFWKNRNLLQEHPEEIDDEQLHCMYNLLILYHISQEELTTNILSLKETDSHQYEELTSFLEKSEQTLPDEILSCIIERLQKAGNVPLVWIERLQLMSEGFYSFAFNKLNKLATLSKEFNTLELYIGSSFNEETTKTYQLSMCEGSFNRTLPLLYALLSYEEGVTALYDWIRTMRNLILNTEIDRKDLPVVIKTIDTFATRCVEENIYTVLRSGSDIHSILRCFNRGQVEEEIMKASELEYYAQMTSLENGRFFSGRIGILFRLLSHRESADYDVLSKENVGAYTSVLLELFDGSDNGVCIKYDDKRFLLRRALLSFPPYYFGKERNMYWSFNNGINEWREYIRDKDSEIGALQHLLKELLVPAFKMRNDINDIHNALAEYVENISKNYENDILINDANSHRFHFIHHPGVWVYMSTQRCIWKDNTCDIELKTSNGNNSNRMELRTYSLYLDYKHNEEYRADRNGWNIGIWPKWKSCFYFECKQKVYDNRTIAIDVYFYDDNGHRDSENCYAFDLFVRPTHPEGENEEEETEYAEKDYNLNKQLFSALIPEQMGLFKKKSDGRLHSIRLYARHELKSVLVDVMNGITVALKNNEQS